MQDREVILRLYKKVAATPGGFARTEDEVTESYINTILHNSFDRGLSLCMLYADKIIGEIHAYTPVAKVFSHVLSDLTICIDPDCQGGGRGRILFTHFMSEVKENMPSIKRIELFARSSNDKAIEFYQSLGFEVEGYFKKRIRGVNKKLEDDVAMAVII